jgi:integrase
LRAFRGYEIKEGILREPFGSRTASEITPQDIDTWLTSHCKTNATANRYRAFFSLAFRLGMENVKIDSNPARLVRRRREDNERSRFLSRDEYKKLSRVIQRDHPKQHPSFVFSVFTGMRWSEQFSLVWQQVDLDRRVVRLTKTKSGSPRNVPLNSEAYAAIQNQRESVAHGPNDLVFPLPGPTADYRWWFMPALANARITGVTWHTLRHTFCSWAAMEGLSLKVIQTLAGHKTITMTARYAHLAPDTSIAASEQIVGSSEPRIGGKTATKTATRGKNASKKMTSKSPIND